MRMLRKGRGGAAAYSFRNSRRHHRLRVVVANSVPAMRITRPVKRHRPEKERREREQLPLSTQTKERKTCRTTWHVYSHTETHAWRAYRPVTGPRGKRGGQGGEDPAQSWRGPPRGLVAVGSLLKRRNPRAPPNEQRLEKNTHEYQFEKRGGQKEGPRRKRFFFFKTASP